MESQAVVAPAASQRRDGHPTLGAPVSIQCHVETKRHLVLTLGGEQVVAEGRVLLDDVYEWIDEQAQLTLPDGSKPPLVWVETTYGPNLNTGGSGPYQTILHFGR